MDESPLGWGLLSFQFLLLPIGLPSGVLIKCVVTTWHCVAHLSQGGRLDQISIGLVIRFSILVNARNIGLYVASQGG